MHRLSRRAVLRLSLFAGAATSLFTFGAKARQREVVTHPLASRLAALARPSESARKFGLACLDVFGEPLQPHDLVEHLGNIEELERMNREGLRIAVRERHRQDLDSGSIVEVRGWVLSRAEASLYALTALVDFANAPESPRAARSRPEIP